MAETFRDLGRDQAINKLYEGCAYSRKKNPVLECAAGKVVSSSVLLLEGVDFDLTFFPLKHLGHKAVFQATGQLYSALAGAGVLNVTIGVSSKLDYPQIKEVWEGICSAASFYGYTEVALDIMPSLTGLSISVSACGAVGEAFASRRPIAKSMDLICISNNTGASFLGQQVLLKGKDMSEEDRTKLLERYRQLVGAYLKPELSSGTLKALQESGIVPSFGFFCKDSLRSTLKSLCAASGLGAKIYVDKLPFAGGSIDAATEFGQDPLQAALKGGDDNCLLFTIPIGSHERFRHDFQSWDVIGHLARPEVGLVMVSPDGLEHEVQ